MKLYCICISIDVYEYVIEFHVKDLKLYQDYRLLILLFTDTYIQLGPIFTEWRGIR